MDSLQIQRKCAIMYFGFICISYIEKDSSFFLPRILSAQCREGKEERKLDLETNRIKEEKGDPLLKIASLIVRSRTLVFLLFAAAAVFCLLSINKVRVNNDLTNYLPPQSETRRGLSIMNEEFAAFATMEVMISNVTYERAEEVSDQISELSHVTGVEFDNTPSHYVHASAHYSVRFDGPAGDPEIKAQMDHVRRIVEPYDHYISSTIIDNYSDQLQGEMSIVILLAVIVIFAVLLLTSRSYFEVVIFAIVFVFAALLNMGTNYLLGEISVITNTIAVIMQLALAIDYAIIFAHRYQDAAEIETDTKKALTVSLSKSIAEIASSSLTTISGLVALTLMQFRLGYDLGIVLSKGILCSMLTVFLLMPGLIQLFPRALRKTQHRKLLPNITAFGRFLVKSRVALVIPFLLLLPFAIYWSSNVNYSFSDDSVDELIYSETREATHKINDTFAPNSLVVVLVPSGNYDAEEAILRDYADIPEIKSATGLANIEIDDSHVLTSRVGPREFSEILDIDLEKAKLLFTAYGLEKKEYGTITAPDEYKAPLVDLFLYVFEKIDQGAVQLSAEQQETLLSLRGSLETGVAQLRGEHYNRFILTAAVPATGDESVSLIELLREKAQAHYEEGEVLVVGDVTSSRDLENSYKSDSKLISFLTIGFVFLILLFTFKTPIGAAVLVFVIQGSIWLNFSFPYLTGTRCSFVTNMIVSAIQMGATIDYAIVLNSRYQGLKALHPKREAMALAVNEAFPTIVTSGAIMSVAGFLIAFRISDVYVGHIGLAVGRGALISVILVMTVLPQLLLLFDKWIEKTTFRIHMNTGGDEP